MGTIQLSPKKPAFYYYAWYKKRAISLLKEKLGEYLLVDLTHHAESDEFFVLSPNYPHRFITPPAKGCENITAASLSGLIEGLKIFEAPDGSIADPKGTEIDYASFELYGEPNQEIKPRMSCDIGPFYGFYPIKDGLNYYYDWRTANIALIAPCYYAQLHLDACESAINKILDAIENEIPVILIDYESYDTTDPRLTAFPFGYFLMKYLTGDSLEAECKETRSILRNSVSFIRERLKETDIPTYADKILPMNIVCLALGARDFVKTPNMLHDALTPSRVKLAADISKRVDFTVEYMYRTFGIQNSKYFPRTVNFENGLFSTVRCDMLDMRHLYDIQCESTNLTEDIISSNSLHNYGFDLINPNVEEEEDDNIDPFLDLFHRRFL